MSCPKNPLQVDRLENSRSPGLYPLCLFWLKGGMDRAASLGERQQMRDRRLAQWGEEHGFNMSSLDEGQRWVVFAALVVLGVIGELKPLKRLLGYMLAHSGLGLGSSLIGALIGVSDRAVRYTQAQSAREMLEHVRDPKRGHAPPKLKPEHAGPIAKYLVEHPRVKAPQILEFVAETFGVTVDRLTLRRYLERYGLGCLREEKTQGTPLF
jgi:transposase